MLQITPRLRIPDDEIEWSAVRARGPGGQHVNKAATAVELRFDIRASSLPHHLKERLLRRRDRRINRAGVVVIKAQSHRSQEQNRREARERLAELIRDATRTPKPRHATRPPRAARERRLEQKLRTGRKKALRRRILPPAE